MTATDHHIQSPASGTTGSRTGKTTLKKTAKQPGLIARGWGIKGVLRHFSSPHGERRMQIVPLSLD
ncbi:hypothetical protein L579_2448 [Pantoea sp. AS-PWVM4]|nr:hypothetical protein L579_2448 [Pantoea sp. AS-PWVM4]